MRASGPSGSGRGRPGDPVQRAQDLLSERPEPRPSSGTPGKSLNLGRFCGWWALKLGVQTLAIRGLAGVVIKCEVVLGPYWWDRTVRAEKPLDQSRGFGRKRENVYMDYNKIRRNI